MGNFPAAAAAGFTQATYDEMCAEMGQEKADALVESVKSMEAEGPIIHSIRDEVGYNWPCAEGKPGYAPVVSHGEASRMEEAAAGTVLANTLAQVDAQDPNIAKTGAVLANEQESEAEMLGRVLGEALDEAEGRKDD